MKAEINIQENSGILTVSTKPVAEVIDWISSMKLVFQAISERDTKKVLIDFRGSRINSSATDIVNYVKTWPEDIMIGCLVDDHNRENQHFVETVSMNRGKMFRTFEDTDAALNWLQSHA